MTRVCELTDAVLAHFLDGETRPVDVEIDGATQPWSAEELARHRGDCDECTLRLAAARRLDALLARSSDVDIEDRDAATLLAAVASRLEPVPVVVSSTRGRWYAVAGALGCGLLGFAVAHLSRSEPAPRPFEPHAPIVAAAIETPHPSGTELVLSGPRRALRSARVANAGSASIALEEILWFEAWTRASVLGWPTDFGSLRASADSAAVAIRSRELRELVAASGADPDRVVAALAAADRGLRAVGLSIIRENEALARRLCTQMRRGEDAAFRLVVQVGGERVDDQILRFVGGDADASDVVAAELALVPVRPGRVALLLELWSGLRTRSSVDDDFELARRWFRPQPLECSRQLVARLRVSRDAEERGLCLLALAARADAGTAEALMAVADGPRQAEAEAAAFALGRLTAGGDELAARPLRRGYLRVAALACRRDPIAAPHLNGMRLSDEERAFLQAGRFDDRQFRIAVALCRERRVAPVFSDD